MIPTFNLFHDDNEFEFFEKTNSQNHSYNPHMHLIIYYYTWVGIILKAFKY
jgi:hypothetical protein